uniref:Methyltransferase small domain-containing protein n=1 Tax=Leersia perrieri TaxID=77586 RepID=A0A0D9X0I6_9ORYZ
MAAAAAAAVDASPIAAVFSDSDSDDLHLPLPNLLPPTTTTAASDAQLHDFHLPTLPSPITIRTLPSLGLTFQLWPSASTLLRILPVSPHLLPRFPTRENPLGVLELGSGTGAAGIALAAALPAHAVLSDLPAALPNLRHNVALNSPLLDTRGGSVSVAPLPWGDAAAMEAVAAGGASRFDLVVASDVVYYEALVDPLIETLRFFVKGEVVFVMAHMRRWKRTDKKFFAKARKVFDVELVHEDPPLEGWRHGPVVYRFTEKKKQHGKK